MQAFYDAVESLPFFSEGRCVTLDLDPDKLDAGQLDELCGVLADPPRTTTVVITVKTPPRQKRKAYQAHQGVRRRGLRRRAGQPQEQRHAALFA